MVALLPINGRRQLLLQHPASQVPYKPMAVIRQQCCRETDRQISFVCFCLCSFFTIRRAVVKGAIIYFPVCVKVITFFHFSIFRAPDILHVVHFGLSVCRSSQQQQQQSLCLADCSAMQAMLDLSFDKCISFGLSSTKIELVALNTYVYLSRCLFLSLLPHMMRDSAC